MAELQAEAVRGLEGEPERVRVRYELRYRGQSFELAVEEGPAPEPAALRDALAREHRERYGYSDEDAEIELVTIRVSVWGSAPEVDLAGGGEAPARNRLRARFGEQWLEAELWIGELPAGASLSGPAICALPESTLVVAPGWGGEVDERGTVVLRREGT